MLKKLTFLTATFLLSFTLAVGAASFDKTLIEEKQAQFIDTADVKYAPSHGKLEVEASLGSGYNGFLQETVGRNFAPNVLLEYSPAKNLQTDAFFAMNTNDVKSQGIWFDVDSNYFFGDVKYKFLENGKLQLAGKVYAESAANKISHTYDDGTVDEFVNDRDTAYGLALLSTYNLRHVELYTNMGVTRFDGASVAGITNGFKAALNERNLIMAKVDTSLDSTDMTFYSSADLLYRAQLHRSIVNLLEVNHDFDYQTTRLMNTTEVRILPTALVTAQLGYSTASDVQNSVGVEVEKGFGPLTVKAGVSHLYEKDLIDSRTSFHGGIQYDVKKNVELSLDLQRDRIDPAGDNDHTTQATMGLTIDL